MNPYTVIGVTDNVIMESPFKPVDPMMVYFDPNGFKFCKYKIEAISAASKSIGDPSKQFLKNTILLFLSSTSLLTRNLGRNLLRKNSSASSRTFLQVLPFLFVVLALQVLHHSLLKNVFVKLVFAKYWVQPFNSC